MPWTELSQVSRFGDLKSADPRLVDKVHLIVSIGLVFDLACNFEEFGFRGALIEISCRACINSGLLQELVDEGTLACSSAP